MRIDDFNTMQPGQLWDGWQPNLPWSDPTGDSAAYTDATPPPLRLDVFYPPGSTDHLVNGALQLDIAPSPDPAETAGKDWIGGMVTQDTVITTGMFLSTTFCLTTAAPGISASAYTISTQPGNRGELDAFELIDAADPGNGKWISQGFNDAAGGGKHVATWVSDITQLHTASIDIEADILTWRLNGKITMQADTPADICTAPSRLTLQAMRGTDGNDTWFGMPNAGTPDHAALRVANVALFDTHPH